MVLPFTTMVQAADTPGEPKLDAGEVEKVVLTHRNQMRAVLLTVERYAKLERLAESAP